MMDGDRKRILHAQHPWTGEWRRWEFLKSNVLVPYGAFTLNREYNVCQADLDNGCTGHLGVVLCDVGPSEERPPETYKTNLLLQRLEAEIEILRAEKAELLAALKLLYKASYGHWPSDWYGPGDAWGVAETLIAKHEEREK